MMVSGQFFLAIWAPWVHYSYLGSACELCKQVTYIWHRLFKHKFASSVSQIKVVKSKNVEVCVFKYYGGVRMRIDHKW